MSDPSAGHRPGSSTAPLVDACRRRGLFELLDLHAFRRRSWLFEKLRANDGYFTIALEVLESLGFVETNADGDVRRTARAAAALEPGQSMVGDLLEGASPQDPDLGAAICAPRVELIDELLFGDHARALREIHDGDRLAMLRTASRCAVIAEELQREIVEIFDRKPLGDQPRAIVHAGFADDATLDGIVRAISSRTVRGRHLAAMPVPLVRAGAHLGGLPSGQLLHLRCFADSLPDIDAADPVDDVLGVLVAEQPAHYVDRHGRSINAAAVLSAWQRHLRDVARSAGSSRLLILQTHAAAGGVPSDTGWLDRLTHEHPISAEAFIVLAASAGLFNDDGVTRHPRSASPCRISLHCFTKRDYAVRYALETDLPRLDELEKLCWQHTRTSIEQIRSRLQKYPQGQFVLEKDGEVLGVVYSQRIADPDALMSRTAADVHSLHDPAGRVIQLLAVNMDPRAQNASYGDQLLEFMLQRCGLMTGIDRVVGVSLCKSFDAAGGRSFEDYIRLAGASQDAVLAFHQSHGAEVAGTIPGYRPEDHANLHNGVLVAYDILHRPRRRGRVEGEERVDGSAARRPAEVTRQQIDRFVRREAAELLGLSEDQVDVERPVMEMGLDSADLLKLQRLCEERFVLRLPAGFFFEHSSIRQVIEYLAVAVATDETPAEIAPQRSPDAATIVQEESTESHRFAPTDIAVVGMACRLPGGIGSPDQFWRVLASGECVIREYPRERGAWPAKGRYPGLDQGGFIDDIDAFDAAFFRMSPAEALMTDPQQRILLELAWTCFEDAGILPATMKGSSTGVFVGASNCDYSRLIQEAGVEIEAHHGVGSSLAVLANRVSYFYDLYGPSLVVDTACSSSLVALHAAVQSLRSGECTAAIAAGVNVICHPDLSVAYHKAGMLAADGRCKVFDARADGYVRAEGAVALLLKPFGAAIAGGNRIHAVIRGSATNHGGLAGGLTVPNPQRQSELLTAAWRDAGLDAHDLSYIEAHGTGTPLGDPIELQGIQTAHARHGGARSAQPCAIGSVKSNLGHLEPAAGITGLLKIILSFQHGQLPASVNFTQLNPRIALAETPFFIPDRLRPWDAGRPRVAAVSSFGSGGTNAHVVVQEYAQHESTDAAAEEQLFVLSASSDERLRVYARQVVDWSKQEEDGVDFADAIYTWQIGRTAMKHRLAIKVKSRGDLLDKLSRWLAGDDPVSDVWSGQVVQKDSSILRAWQTKAGRQLIDQSLAERDLDPVAALWVSGTEIDWHRLYTASPHGRMPRPVSLVTYPFAKERYWIDATTARREAAAFRSILHPLLHTNSSDLTRQSYSATFSGEELFLADHRVRGEDGTLRKVLPAVAYVEMVRAAIELAVPGRSDSQVLELRDVVWMRPFIATGPAQISIVLADDDEEVRFEIYSGHGDAEVVHCEGRAAWRSGAIPSKIDLEELGRGVSEGALQSRAVYETCERMGLAYGPAFQGIARLTSGNHQSLAQLRLPTGAEETAGDYGLHPSVMDGALQAAVLLIGDGLGPSDRPRLPFVLDSLRVLAPTTREMTSWVRYAPGSRRGSDVAKVDIDLCDASGNVCVEMRGLSLRPAGGEAAVRSVAPSILLATPVWEPDREQVATETGETAYSEHHVLLTELPEVDVAKLEALFPGTLFLALHGDGEETIARRYSEHAMACFARTRAILERRPQGKVLLQVVIADHQEKALLAGISGLLDTASLENPQFSAQVILVGPQVTAEELAGHVRAGKRWGQDRMISHAGDGRQVLRWQEVAAVADAPPAAFRDDGVYLITGGLGGLGLRFAREILATTRNGRVVLTGRSALSDLEPTRLSEISAQPGRLSYRQLDLGDLDQVTQLIGEIGDEYRRLDGVLHCAGMIADTFIVKKDGVQFREVLAPKVAGTYNLDQATRDVELDFFVMFSSFASAIGNVGQADYAAANGFMDHFAAYRNERVAAKLRHGRTRSIHWPLWRDGGMKMDAASQELLQRATGLQPLESSAGIDALHRSLALPYDRVLVLYGNPSELRRAFLGAPEPLAAPQSQRSVAAAPIDAAGLLEKAQDYLRKQLSGVLKLPADRIDPQASLEEYGIDSMLAMKLTNQLEETFGTLSRTLFFEYRTIRELAGYFIEHNTSQLAAILATPASGTSAPIPAPPTAAPKVVSTSRLTRARRAATAKEPDPVAIIGLSGRYPGAIDIDAYWRNLRDGRDCIVEIPADRWDWRAYYSDDRTANGRHYSKWGGFITGVDEFDPLFFNVSPREAKYIDPQERLFLQHAWMAIEDAGYTRATLQVPDQDLPSQVGVYVGVMWSEYQLFGAEADAGKLRMGFAGNMASIANRVSYVLDLHGPSMTLDTMCSSSLTAVHVACQDLKAGRTRMAIAGGVNVSIHPNKYRLLSVGQFISSDGHCQSFGEGGDGYIPGEGVGAVVLKRLADAKRDGDHIYGIIRGSALTHGGKTNGYTVPNPQAQGSAISRALAESRVDPRHVSYVEAHGTGTKLGDPIEIAALSKAFERQTQDKGFCLIGSAKSNIGHCESAAGIAGLTKVLLQMQHRQVAASLHSSRLNPFIDFARTPFVVSQTLQPWERPVIDGREVPRIAGISSFGAGGSNAHMIVEEYQPPAERPVALAAAAIVLSARTADQLRQRVLDLSEYVRPRLATADLASIAYTLQVGREAMEERLGFVARSVEELAQTLDAYLAGRDDLKHVYRGVARRGKETLPLGRITDGDVAKLVELWVHGHDPDWPRLYGSTPPLRVSLPTYPFARERYWVDRAPASDHGGRAPSAAVLHPLLHSNASDLFEQRFYSTFTGEETFLVGDAGQKLLPAAACLEMARAAIEHALPQRAESAILELREIVWAGRIVVTAGQQIGIALSPRDDEQIDYEIYSVSDGEEIVHCQGRAAWSREPAPDRLDLERLEAQGETLVPAGADSSGEFVIEPAVMERALAAAFGTSGRSLDAVQLVRIVSATVPKTVAWMRESQGGGAGDGTVRDIDLCDDRGKVAVQLRGACWREPAEAAVEPAALETTPERAVPPTEALVRREIAFIAAEEEIAAPAERRKSVPIALAAPGAVTAPPAVASGRARVTLSAASTSAPGPRSAAPPASAVNLYACGNGVFSIEIAASRSNHVLAHTLQALERVRQEPTLKVLMLSGIEDCFVHGGREEYNEAVAQGLFRRLISFEYPVIALLPGDVVGAGLLAAALCDFMVCDEDAVYGYTDPADRFYPTAAEAVVFRERFGAALAHDLLYVSPHATGRQMRAKGWACPIVPWEQVAEFAEHLASDLATKSRDALRLLKKHLTRALIDPVAALTCVDVANTAAEELATEHPVRIVRYGVDDIETLIGSGVAGPKAIVLAVDECDVPEHAVADLRRLLIESEIPVVAALTGSATGHAWLVSLFCDACVYSRTAVYSAAAIAQGFSSTAVAVYTERFGADAAGEILLTGGSYGGADLQERTGVTLVVDPEQVLPAAVQLGERWAGMPRAVLVSWKKQTATFLSSTIESLPASNGVWKQQSATVDRGAIVLRSPVVTAAAHPEGIVVVTMEDRNAKNMFSDALVDGMREVFAHIEATPAYKVVVLTGYDHYFASGGTKDTLLAIQEGKTRFTDLDLFHVARECRLPVIAAMQGHAIGAGWSMGMFADLVLLSEESRYVSPYMSYGFTPGAGATYSLMEKLGSDLARESLLTARQYAGRELKERGLQLRVVRRADVVSVAMTLAKRIARLSRDRAIDLKRQLTAGFRRALDETYRLELEMHESTFVGRADTLARIEAHFHQDLEPPPVEAPAARVERASAAGDGDALAAVTAAIRTLLADELQMRESDIDDDAQFVDLGLDSITGVTWIRKINQKYETSIEATKVYSYPTLTQLGQHVKEEAVRSGTLASQSAVPPIEVSAAAAKPAPAVREVTSKPAKEKLLSRRRKASSRFLPVAAPTRPIQRVAIIGMAGQFPRAGDLDEFWRNIAQGRNCISEVPKSRWDADLYYQPGEPMPGKTNSRWAGLLDEYDRFDPLFFSISPTEAENMDPQQRLFLQACWHSIESAGYDAQALSGSRCGVFVGCTADDYHQTSRQHQWSAQGFTGGSTSIVAGRISYFLNLQGPSVSIDTACSSALVAVAQACDSLIAGGSDVALAGGVYVMTGPGMHIKTSQAGMLSPEGTCFTFDQRADGFVPGEGVGVVLLKRLADAERDRDIIYGVIEGWGMNQDGKTNGLTAPNPESQTRLEQDVYDRFRIDPATIQLIEAHGTGTKLGDPIEVEGLKNAFRKYTQNRGYCALGSVKSNIGHCLTAAGIAGLLKLVLALRRRQLPPTIHFERLNEHIDLEGSPFYVNSRLRDWDLDGAAARRAAISSFGFSGTNAHVVLGEYEPPAGVERKAAGTPPARVIVPLSARTAERLDQKARDLLQFLRVEGQSTDLAEIAYTLQAGRTAMDERLAFVVSSTGELAEKLQAYLDGRDGIVDAHRGRVRRNRESTSIFSLDEDTVGALVAKWLAANELSRMCNLWVNGLSLDWSMSWGEVPPRRISLPLYPFAKERHWIEVNADDPTALPQTVTATLHPLLHRNTSDLSEQRYRSTFTGEEPFLSAHRVDTGGGQVQRVLPGVAYLEMARAAIGLAWPAELESRVLELHDIVWMKPVVVEAPREISVALSASGDDRVDFEIHSDDGARQSIVHCQGTAAFARRPEPGRIDLAELRRQMDQGALDASAVYEMFVTMGLHYGLAHRGIETILLGHGQLLAQLRVPADAGAGAHAYVLHPGLMDSALQASIGLIVDRNHVPDKPVVPFAMDSLRVGSACTSEMAAWVRLGGENGHMRLDIDLLDDQGTLCVEMRGLALRVMDGQAKEQAGPGLPSVADRNAPFDDAFYERVLADVLDGEVSIEEAASLR